MTPTEKQMNREASQVAAAVLKAARDGNITAARLVLDRIAPPARGRLVRFPVPAMTNATDIIKALHAILAAVGNGRITPDEAATLTAIVEAHRRAFETVDLETRIAALEES